MTNVITLSEAKSHLRVTNNTEDTAIQLYIDAAGEYIARFLNTPNFAHTANIKAAALLLVGDLFENRQAGSEKDIKENPAVMRLLSFDREGMGI